MSGFFIIDSKDKRTEAAQFVARLPASLLYSVEIKPYKRNRSLAQNRLYWGVVGAIADYTGYSSDELHEMFKVKLLGVEVRNCFGQIIILPKSSADLSTTSFAEYMTKIISVATYLNVVVPYTDEYDYALHK